MLSWLAGLSVPVRLISKMTGRNIIHQHNRTVYLFFTLIFQNLLFLSH